MRRNSARLRLANPLVACAVLVLLLALAGCGAAGGQSAGNGRQPAVVLELSSDADRAPADEATEEEVSELTGDSRSLAVDLLQRLSARGDNLIFSPWGLMTALGMTHDGARGVTQEKIASALHLSIPSVRLPAAMNALNLALSATAAPEFHSATAFWAPTDMEFKQDYLDLIARYYGSWIFQIDINQDRNKASEMIANWLANEIGEGFDDEWKPPGSQAAPPVTQAAGPVCAVLTSAVRLDAQWSHPFDPASTHEAPFTLEDGTQVLADTMIGHGDFLAAEGDDYVAVGLPYAGDSLAFVAVQPKTAALSDFVQSLTAEKLARLLEDLVAGESLNVLLPKFAFKRALDLTPVLESMGMTLGSESDDFSGMSDSWQGDIEGVAQQAYIEVNEEGTEAGAATEVTIAAGISDSVEFNRPFLFVIEHVSSRLPLFVGLVMDPRNER